MFRLVYALRQFKSIYVNLRCWEPRNLGSQILGSQNSGIPRILGSLNSVIPDFGILEFRDPRILGSQISKIPNSGIQEIWNTRILGSQNGSEHSGIPEFLGSLNPGIPEFWGSQNPGIPEFWDPRILGSQKFGILEFLGFQHCGQTPFRIKTGLRRPKMKNSFRKHVYTDVFATS